MHKILRKKKNDSLKLVSYFYFSNHINWYNKLLLKKHFMINFLSSPTKYQMQLKLSSDNDWNNYLTRL